MKEWTLRLQTPPDWVGLMVSILLPGHRIGSGTSRTLKTNGSQGKLLWDAGKISPGSRSYEIRQINLKCVATGKLTWYVISFSILRYRSIFGYRSYIRSITSLVFSKGSTHLGIHGMNVTKNFEKNFLCTQAPVPKSRNWIANGHKRRIHSWLNVLIVDRLFCLVTLNCLEEENLRVCVYVGLLCVAVAGSPYSFSTLLVCFFWLYSESRI